jgi:hypothetical protein
MAQRIADTPLTRQEGRLRPRTGEWHQFLEARLNGVERVDDFISSHR